MTEDTFTRTVEDAEAFERWRAGPYFIDEDDFDDDAPDDDAPDDDADDANEPCCNEFSCPCGGFGSVRR